MPRIVKGGLIQCSVSEPTEKPIDVIKKSMIDKHIALIEEAGKKGVQILCLQEIFFGPYFCAEQKTKWYAMVEKIPDGPTVKLMQEYAKKYSMAIVVPIYEEEMTGIYYNTAAVIDADGKYLGKYRKHHIPQVDPGFWEKFYFKPGNLGYPVFKTRYADIGIYICYDRHFPEGARILGLHGAEIETYDNFIGFGLYDRKVVEIVKTFDDPYPYFRGMIAEIGLEHKELAYNQARRKQGVASQIIKEV